MLPKVTIVLRTYNCAKFVQQAVFSVTSQDYPNLEVIVTDDCSSDGTRQILEKLEKEFSNLEIIKNHSKSKGLQLSKLHSLLSKSSSKYLGWVDGDDILLPGAIKTCVEQMEKLGRTVGMVYTNYSLIDENGRDYGLGLRCQVPFDFDKELVNFSVFHFRLFSQEAWKKVGGFDKALTTHEDWDLVLRISEKFDIVRIPKNFYLYRRHSGSTILQNQENYHKLLADSVTGKKVIESAISRRKINKKVNLMFTPSYRLS